MKIALGELWNAMKNLQQPNGAKQKKPKNKKRKPREAAQTSSGSVLPGSPHPQSGAARCPEGPHPYDLPP